MKCQECGKEFDPANRASVTAPEGSILQIRYCSQACKRRAGNRRNYQRRKARKGGGKCSTCSM